MYKKAIEKIFKLLNKKSIFSFLTTFNTHLLNNSTSEMMTLSYASMDQKA